VKWRSKSVAVTVEDFSRQLVQCMRNFAGQILAASVALHTKNCRQIFKVLIVS